ncbi:MAG: hypothetical protein WBA51_18970 [Erythrobacter sp.]
MHGKLDYFFATHRTPMLDGRAANVWLGHIALGLLVFTVFAFGLKAVTTPAVHARYTPIVVIHALSMIAWLMLLMTQAYLIGRGSLGLHRRLGQASITLVAVMSISGGIISVNIGEELGRPEVTVVNLFAFFTFLPLYAAALYFARRRDIQTHRLAMLIGTLAFMTPAYARVVQVLGLPDPVAIAVDVALTGAIAVGYDWAASGRITKALIWMLGFSYGLLAAMIAILVIWFI